jgi:hypothetical protein
MAVAQAHYPVAELARKLQFDLGWSLLGSIDAGDAHAQISITTSCVLPYFKPTGTVDTPTFPRRLEGVVVRRHPRLRRGRREVLHAHQSRHPTPARPVAQGNQPRLPDD